MSNTGIGGCGISLATAISLTLLSAQLQAQTVFRIEEVVVTGSYIKRDGVDQFNSASPVEVITNEDVLQAGKSNIGEFVRDLTFTQNTDTVANILAFQDGGQDSTTARFNIRGLGVGSTLTLFDSRRSVAQFDVGSYVPELALQRIDVVLDGGAALYGTDAVAGVVNFIPIKKFEGYKARVFYSQDDGNDSHEPKYSLLWGDRYFDRMDVVAAVDYSKRSPLRRTERPRYLRADDNDSAMGNPGQFQRLLPNGQDAPGAFLVPGVLIRDPGCGTFNQGNDDDGLAANNPSGIPGGTDANPTCSLKFGDQQDFIRGSEELDSYANVVFDLTDRVKLEFQANATMRTTFARFGSLANANNNRLLVLPVENPGNPTRGTTMPSAVRASSGGFIPFGKSGTLPSHLDETGAQTQDFTQLIDRYKVGALYDFGNSGWSGETYLSIQTARLDIDARYLRLDRLREALLGRGGPNGNEFFNPTASADPRSPMFVASGPNKTANSQELVDFLFERDRYENSRQRLTYVESIVTGDLFKLPAGEVAVAGGLQIRNFVTKDYPNPVEARGLDYGSATVNLITGAPITPDTVERFENRVNAAFTELQIPIFSSLTLQAAARYEDFRDVGLDTVTPKIALRYNPLDWLAFRASYNEGFLAPSTEQVRFLPDRNCGEAFAGVDPFRLMQGANGQLNLGASLIGTRNCSTGNPSLDPEESESINVGFSVRPIQGMDISLDYQRLEYTDRIQMLTNQDVLTRDFGRFLMLNNLTNESFRAMSDASRTALISSYFASGAADPNIIRSASGAIQQITATPANVTGNEVDVLDLRFSYGRMIGNLGYFFGRLSTTYYDKYEYTDLAGMRINALGKRNADTALAPPLPEFRHTLNLGWVRKKQSAGITVRYTDSVLFDGPGDDFADAFPPPRTISSDTKVDVRYTLQVDKILNGNWSFTVGSNNVLDARADVLPVFGGLETRLQDPIGRTVYAEINAEF